MKNIFVSLLFLFGLVLASAQTPVIGPPQLSGGVKSINGAAGSFIFNGTGVNCTATTCTFTGAGSGTVNAGTTGQIAYYPGNGAAVSGTSAVGSIGLPLTPSSAGAAAANIAVINTCLSTSGGTCYISGTAGTVYYINGPMVQYSNTKLKMDPGVIVKSNNNTTVWVNYGYTQPFIASTGCTWTSGDTCTLNFPAHGFPIGSGTGFGGQWVYAQASEWFISTSTVATYASGASACTNGTQNVSLTNAANVAFPNVGTITVSGGVPTGTITFTNVGTTWGFTSPYSGTVATCTGTATFNATGTVNTDGAFSGVFRVVSVTDANNVVIKLNRIPAAALAGPYYVKHADVNLQAENVTLDYSSGTGVGLNSHASLFLGVHGFQHYGQYQVLNGSLTTGYGMMFAGVDDFHMRGFYDPTNEFKDGLQGQGPVTNSSFENTYAYSSDDIFALYADDGGYQFWTLSPNYFGAGDFLNVNIDGVHGITGVHCVSLNTAAPSGYWFDKVTVKNGDCHSEGGTASPGFFTLAGGGFAGTMSFEDITCTMDWTSPCIGIGPVTVANLYIRRISGPKANNSSNVTLFTSAGSGTTIQNLIADGVDFRPHNTGDVAFSIPANSVITNIDVSHFYVPAPSGSVFPNVISSAATGVASIHVHDGTDTACGSVVNVSAAGPQVKADNIYWDCGSGTVQGMLQASAATTFLLSNNKANHGWLVGCGGSITCTVNSLGGNTSNTGTDRFIGASSGTPTFNLFAPLDGFVTVDNARLGHPAGSQIQNINATYGTGQMVSNGTIFVPVSTTATFSAAASVGTISASAGATNNGVTIGSYTSSTSGTVTVVITPGYTSRGTGFNCSGHDLTTPADTITQSASSTTTCTLTGTVVSGDVVQFTAQPY